MLSPRKTLLGGALMVISATAPGMTQDLDWPQRETSRPRTTDDVPHVQIGVAQIPELSDELLRRIAEIPDVVVTDAIASLPGATGLWIEEDVELARPEVIVRGREFAHIHPDGSLHASLPPQTAKVVSQKGWSIAHPWADQRPGWEGFVMIYTPMTPQEVDVVFDLVLLSYQFVTGRSDG